MPDAAPPVWEQRTAQLPATCVIGLIGMGDMGCLYADRLSAHPKVSRVLACDLPSEKQRLEDRYRDNAAVHILDTGALVARAADIIIYSVEAANFGKVVAQFGAASKVGSIVMGQSSVKQLEIDAFDAHLPADVSVVPCHSLHGPLVDTKGQTCVIVDHKVEPTVLQQLEDLFCEAFQYKMVRMSVEDHDSITANTQVLTHIAFESMGTAWRSMGCFPWEQTAYIGGIDNVKILACLRIYSSKAHVYCGLALLNPRAKEQVMQYNQSTADLFKLMITEDEGSLRDRVLTARDALFGNGRKAALLPDSLLQEFALGLQGGEAPYKRNSHLSILAMVDSWHQLGIKPYQDLVCETPVFRLRLGIAEYLFTNSTMLEDSIRAACFDKSIRADDFAFTASVREWATIVSHGDADGYVAQFEQTREFFRDRLAEGMQLSTKLIRRLSEEAQKG
eukprot:TRINITY_DN20988_c0_g2_i1.p1 TRINITY_DN20988_c0_g2~~TRINITY_DN20988_c0_g2_i1.p1  ORF type:complete len:460 (+),score=135.62 TRINITY_DN20988_c0_g2_i1:39-1382(+)